jgi:hypothetical protein
MPSTEELQARALAGEDVWVGHVLLIDGVSIGFTDHAGLVGVSTSGLHQVRLGLQRDGLSFRMALDLRTGQLLDSPLSCTVVDFEGDLAALWRSIDDTERALEHVPIGGGTNIHPNSDLTSRTELHSRNVGLERIGAAGQRHRFPVPVTYGVGLDHGIGQPELDLEGSPVSENPIVWNGRRAVLYRCYRDHITYPDDSSAGWRPFSEAVRIWWGTMRDAGEVSGREWSLDFDGPESWLRKPLGLGYQTKPATVAADVELIEEERGIGVALMLDLHGGSDRWAAGLHEFSAPTMTGVTLEQIRDEVRTEIAATAADAGADGTWDDEEGFMVAMDASAVVSIAVPEDQSAYWADGLVAKGMMQLVLHHKVWALLGYDIEQQRNLYPDPEDPRALNFYEANEANFDGLPGPGYWIGYFVTGGVDLEVWPNGPTNGGATRYFQPWYQGGTMQLLADPTNGGEQAGQLIRMGDSALGVDTSSTTLVHPGQLDRPIASSVDDATAPAQIDGFDCDRQGLWLFYGKRRLGETEDEVDEYQVARCSWVGGGAGQDGCVFGDTLLITEWLAPGRFGFNRDRLGSNTAFGGDWIARRDTADPDEGMVQAVPLLTLGYFNGSSYDRADIVLQRLLVTSGTSDGWTSYEGDPAAVVDPGDNEPSGAHTIGRDVEVAALGLGIPDSMVAPISDFDAQAGLLDAGEDAILDVKVAFSSGYQSEDVLRSLMQPIGWSWHLRNGQYGVWCPADPVTLADATVALSPSVKTASYKQRGRRTIKQDIRKWQPIDLFKVERSWAPHLNKVTETLELRSQDRGMRYRPGSVTETVKAHWYRGAGGLVQRLAHVARFWAKRHFEVRAYPVPMLGVGEQLWPGSIVRLTDPELVDPSGSYGVVNRLAIVTGCATTMDQDDGTKTVDLLVLADRSTTPRLHAPSAIGRGYNSATERLYIDTNWARIEAASWSDGAHFVEPSYDGIPAFGGNAEVVWWQWDGIELVLRGGGTVIGFGHDDVLDLDYLQLDNASGLYYRDQPALVVLAPTTTANAAFVDELYAPICDDAGLWTDVAAPTDGYPWET